jgi:voltage-gated potassium channel Kch
MEDSPQESTPERSEYAGVYSHGMIRLSGPVDWPDGTAVTVRIAEVSSDIGKEIGKVIIAGFGLAGRWVADIFDRHGIDYVIVELNPATIQTQRKLGRKIVQGDIGEEATLRSAGIHEASILALTIPDETAVFRATRTARALNPNIYIVARTNYSSAGMQATQCGADEVIKAEQVIARQFYEMLLRKVGARQCNDNPHPESSPL